MPGGTLPPCWLMTGALVAGSRPFVLKRLIIVAVRLLRMELRYEFFAATHESTVR